MTAPVRRSVAVLADDGVDGGALRAVWCSFDRADVRVSVVSPQQNRIAVIDAPGLVGLYRVDKPLVDARGRDYDAVVVPDGTGNQERLRRRSAVAVFLREMLRGGKVVGTGPGAGGVLVAADAVRGRRVTSGPMLSAELRWAGARWLDAPFVSDGPVVTFQRRDHALLAGAVLAVVTDRRCRVSSMITTPREQR